MSHFVPDFELQRGSHRSLVVEESVEQTVSSGAAFVLPIVASVVLLSLYYYFSSLQLLLSAYTAVVSLISVGMHFGRLRSLPFVRWQLSFPRVAPSGLCITPLLQCAFERLRNPLSATSLRWFGASLATMSGFLVADSLSALFLSFLTIACYRRIVLSWMVTGHWALNDVIGVSICVTMLSVVRLPNLRVAVICLTGLLLYDAFWVYSSPSLFGENVMVTVAMQRTDNPVYTGSHAYR